MPNLLLMCFNVNSSSKQECFSTSRPDCVHGYITRTVGLILEELESLTIMVTVIRFARMRKATFLG